MLVVCCVLLGVFVGCNVSFGVGCCCCELFAVCLLVWRVFCLLRVVRWVMVVACCALVVDRGLKCDVRCELFVVCCTILIVCCFLCCGWLFVARWSCQLFVGDRVFGCCAVSTLCYLLFVVCCLSVGV